MANELFAIFSYSKFNIKYNVHYAFFLSQHETIYYILKLNNKQNYRNLIIFLYNDH